MDISHLKEKEYDVNIVRIVDYVSSTSGCYHNAYESNMALPSSQQSQWPDSDRARFEITKDTPYLVLMHELSQTNAPLLLKKPNW